MITDFKKFILHGNVVDLAVGVVIGVAFGAVVTSFVEGLITPLIAAIGGEPDFSSLSFTINGSQFMYGQFINAVISFLIIATVVFFLVIQPTNKLKDRLAKSKKSDDPTEKKCSECLNFIAKDAKRCMYCTAKI
jgi:large conductance mechanosensitive channel